MSTKPQTIHYLDAGQALSLTPAHGQRLRVIAGRLWVTQSGRPDDHFLSAGHSLKLDERGRAVIEADDGCAARYVVEALTATLYLPTERPRQEAVPPCGLTGPSRKPAAA